MRTVLLSVSVLLAAAITTPARADTHLVLEAGTDFPLDVNAKALLELPGRFRINASVGVMPSFYVSGYTGTEVLFTKYNQQTADVVKTAINSSLVGRIHLGWRPWEAHGFYFDLGYGFAAFGGGNSLATYIARATGRMPPPEPDMQMSMNMDPSMNPYSVNSVLHMVDLEFGWSWKLFWQIEARVAAGAAWTFASSSTITPAFPSKAPTSDQTAYTKSVASYLDGMNKNAITPLITVGLGWRIF